MHCRNFATIKTCNIKMALFYVIDRWWECKKVFVQFIRNLKDFVTFWKWNFLLNRIYINIYYSFFNKILAIIDMNKSLILKAHRQHIYIYKCIRCWISLSLSLVRITIKLWCISLQMQEKYNFIMYSQRFELILE